MSDIVSQKLSVHQQHELLLALERAGLSPQDAQRAIEDREIANAMVQQATRSSSDSACPVEQAFHIMDDNFHGIDALERHLGVKLSAKSKKLFLTVPFSAEELQACRETHVLVACGALSLMDVWQAQTGLFYARRNPWYGAKSEQWARSKVKAGWQLIRKGPVPDSTNKTWNEQEVLLTDDELVPSASVLAQAILIHYLETGERLFWQIYASVSEVGSGRSSTSMSPSIFNQDFWLEPIDTSGGHRVHLGYFDSLGLNISDYWGSCCSGNVGLASSRKFS